MQAQHVGSQPSGPVIMRVADGCVSPAACKCVVQGILLRVAFLCQGDATISEVRDSMISTEAEVRECCVPVWLCSLTAAR